MFLRSTARKKDGTLHRYWSVVENRRLRGGRVLQRHVLYLGEINSSQERAWRKSVEVFDEHGESSQSLALFPDDQVDEAGVDESIVRLRLPRSRKGTRWDQVLFVLVDLLGVDESVADIHKLYECHDRLLAHKTAVFDHLVARWRDLFNATFDVLLYDLTSTYFESNPPFEEDDKRRYGYSRDKRSDCVQIVIALVVTPEGLPLAVACPELVEGKSSPAIPRTAPRCGVSWIASSSSTARRAGVGDGPRRSDRSELAAHARERSTGALPGRHAPGASVETGEGASAQALARSPARRAGEAAAAGR